MARAVVRHVASGLVVLVVVTFATFALVRTTPGNTATSIALRQAGAAASTEQIERIRTELKLDDSLVEQYGVWLTRAVTGDLGRSERSGRPVAEEVGLRLPRTLFLAGGAGLLAVLLGLAAGTTAAVVRRGPAPGVLRVGALAAASVPPFWLAFVLIAVLSERLGLLPTSGQAGAGSWLMPWIVLAIPAAATISRVVAVAVTATLAQPYVTAARARGASTRSILFRDALPNAVRSTLDVTALQLGIVFTGTVVVETVFAWPGLGAWFVDAVKFRDNWAILAGVLVFAVGFIALTRLADLVQVLIDPRLRRSAAR
ncbi:ABC transporter permease [Nocardioides sp. zg-536]|uniref:ABC transporter permease n=1 Tax=Nocardioides faecalis TaxID=2803858 RepID=A0A938Y0Z3_9ACTN|nr:ABC transporter permease [Nocardioides faecalis]MBM9460157.1 ABC transporter permease [Nocardioides faecalis]QVI60048.1 ABC transporter permease [Nocardioides faecalis]